MAETSKTDQPQPDYRWGTPEGSREFDRLIDRSMTFRERLQWLEDAETLALRMAASRVKDRSSYSLPVTRHFRMTHLHLAIAILAEVIDPRIFPLSAGLSDVTSQPCGSSTPCSPRSSGA